MQACPEGFRNHAAEYVSYIEISAHFGIESVENFVANRQNRFIHRYGETGNYLCQMLCADWSVCLSDVFLFSVCLISVC